MHVEFGIDVVGIHGEAAADAGRARRRSAAEPEFVCASVSHLKLVWRWFFKMLLSLF